MTPSRPLPLLSPDVSMRTAPLSLPACYYQNGVITMVIFSGVVYGCIIILERCRYDHASSSDHPDIHFCDRRNGDQNQFSQFRQLPLLFFGGGLFFCFLFFLFLFLFCLVFCFVFCYLCGFCFCFLVALLLLVLVVFVVVVVVVVFFGGKGGRLLRMESVHPFFRGRRIVCARRLLRRLQESLH